MAIVPGHVLVLKLPFASGAPCLRPRPFLVIDRNEDTLDLINVSSSRGKERKLLFESNEPIEKYYPPLDYPSFIKMDELYTIDYFEELHNQIYKRRPPLDSDELTRLTYEYMEYREKNEIAHVRYFETMVKEENSL